MHADFTASSASGLSPEDSMQLAGEWGTVGRGRSTKSKHNIYIFSTNIYKHNI